MQPTRKILLASILLTTTLSASQAGHGTIVILDFAKDKMTVAADSRISFDNKPADDSFCKIDVFRHRIVFAQMGQVGYNPGSADPFPSWRNADLARRAVREMGSPTKDPDVELKDLASIWGTTLALYWNRAYRTSPDTVARIAKPAGDLLTAAVFAEARNGEIHWKYVGVGLNPTLNPPLVQSFTANLRDCWPCGDSEKVCAMARPNVAREFCTQSTDRAKDEATHWHPTPELEHQISRETLHASRLVDLTEAFDPIGGLGGQTDALELHGNGSINWIFRKPICPDNED